MRMLAYTLRDCAIGGLADLGPNRGLGAGGTPDTEPRRWTFVG